MAPYHPYTSLGIHPTTVASGTTALPSEPDIYQVPKDKRCRRCAQEHGSRPCSREVSRARAARKCFILH